LFAGFDVADPILKTHNVNWFPISSMDLAPGAPHEVALRNELLRLEESRGLASSARLRHLLRYLFTETLEGRCDQITQYSIAFDCYGMGDGFDTTTNTLVRSHARRLRQILNDLAPESGAARILMRERGYSLVLEVAATTLSPATTNHRTFRLPSLGIMEFEIMPGAELPHHLAKSLASELMVELADLGNLEAVGPFPRAMLPNHSKTAAELTRHHGLDMMLDGSIIQEGGKFLVYPKVVDGKTGGNLWAMRDGMPSSDTSSEAIQMLAGILTARVAGEWGPILSHVAKLARSRTDEPLRLHEAVTIARQYLSNFHYEQLGRCVETLRQGAMDSEDAAVPATLVVLLNAAGSVEPRWHETIDRREIGELSARASRLDPEDPWTRLAMAVAAMLDGRFGVLLEMARRADQEPGTPIMLVGALGSMICFQKIDLNLARRMLDRYCQNCPNYPRLVHLSLALAALSENDLATARAELARYGVPWGWAFPLIAAACAAIEGDADTARSEWQRVLSAYPDFPYRWRETIATQWSQNYLHHIFAVLENAGVHTGCL
jgi:TolB-like protein